MLKRKKAALLPILVSVFVIYAAIPTYAMHIMDGYLSGGFSIAWGAICIPFLIAGLRSIRKKLAEEGRNISMLAMSGAFIFLISSLKIPSVTGSCSHMTGTGLGAILLGPAPVAVLGLIVLLFQALLLAHGGITTLGANTFSMAIAGPFLTYFIYKGCKKAGMKNFISIFLAASLGDIFTYCITSMQLALAFPSAEGGTWLSALKFLGVFAPTQLPLALIEGMLTVMIIMALENYAKPELKALGFIKED